MVRRVELIDVVTKKGKSPVSGALSGYTKPNGTKKVIFRSGKICVCSFRGLPPLSLKTKWKSKLEENKDKKTFTIVTQRRKDSDVVSFRFHWKNEIYTELQHLQEIPQGTPQGTPREISQGKKRKAGEISSMEDHSDSVFSWKWMDQKIIKSEAGCGEILPEIDDDTNIDDENIDEYYIVESSRIKAEMAQAGIRTATRGRIMVDL